MYADECPLRYVIAIPLYNQVFPVKTSNKCIERKTSKIYKTLFFTKKLNSFQKQKTDNS